LEVFEQVFFGAGGEVEAEAIGPFEDSSAGDYLIRRILKELKLSNRIAFDIVKLYHLVFNLRHLRCS
jgi:hypothetical protein